MDVVVALYISDAGNLEYEVLCADTQKSLGYFTEQEAVFKFCYADNDYDIKEWV